jgi:isochorismate pyruvate lyase
MNGEGSGDVSHAMSLDEVRAVIDRIDAALIGLLAERAGYVRRAGELKRTEAEARAPARVEAVIARVRERAAAAGLSPEVAERTWRAMIAAFIDQEIAGIRGREG